MNRLLEGAVSAAGWGENKPPLEALVVGNEKVDSAMSVVAGTSGSFEETGPVVAVAADGVCFDGDANELLCPKLNVGFDRALSLAGSLDVLCANKLAKGFWGVFASSVG